MKCKKLLALFFAFVIVFAGTVSACKVKPTTDKDIQIEKHLIVNETGDYGGTLNASLYGVGTPKNGELDVKDDVYYPVNDYYNAYSTETRTIIHGFSGYQQTMANSDGIACALMILNYDGEDVKNTYNELNLVKTYERLDGSTVRRSGCSPTGLYKLFNNLGYTATAEPAYPKKRGDFSSWIKSCIKSNKYVLVRWQTSLTARWNIVIGYDTMGTVNELDDVIILADPFDASDHFQDGYYTYQFARFYHWWRVMDQDNIGVLSSYDCLIVHSKTTFDFSKHEKDIVHNYPEVAPLNRLLNKDGTIGGFYGDARYSSGSVGTSGYDPTVRQETEHVDYNYYKFPDYCNMQDTDTRFICTGYRAYTQTMYSSCGICSTMSILEYYGYDWVSICDLITRTDWCDYETDEDKKFGPIAPKDYGLKQEAFLMLYMQGDSYFSDKPSSKFYRYGGVSVSKLKTAVNKLGYTGFCPTETKPFKTYGDFLKFAKNYLSKDEPFVILWDPTGGHYEVAIGIDDMGTENIYDDVIILGDSSDTVDHYKDGFNTLPAVTFLGTWYNKSVSNTQRYLHINRK